MNLATTEATYLQVIRGKTAALFEAACEVGGVIAGQPEHVVSGLARYGDGLGIAFQMADDLLDWGGASGEIGKNTGDDFRERKLTLPVIRAVARADKAEREFWVRTIEKGDQREGDLDQAMEILRRRETLEETREEAHRHADAARDALQDVPAHELTDMLRDLAGYVVSRLN
jgi:octaprenyl-diphosphate synthase